MDTLHFNFPFARNACLLAITFLLPQAVFADGGCPSRDYPDEKSYSEIHYTAACTGWEIRQLVAAGHSVDALSKERAATPLHYAAYFGNKDAVEKLIELGAKVSIKDRAGWTPLTASLSGISVCSKRIKQHIDVVKILFLANAGDLNGHEEGGVTILASAVKCLGVYMAEARARPDGFSRQKIIQEAQEYDATLREFVVWAIDNKANVNARTHGQWTALHFAVLRGDREIVDSLVKAGADVNAKTVTGVTPLSIALGYINGQQKRQPKREIADLLRRAGAGMY